MGKGKHLKVIYLVSVVKNFTFFFSFFYSGNCKYALILLLICTPVLSYNVSHIVGHRGQDNGMSLVLRVVICSDKVCHPRRVIGSQCVEYIDCLFPCQERGECRMKQTTGHMCLRYDCYNVSLKL